MRIFAICCVVFFCTITHNVKSQSVSEFLKTVGIRKTFDGSKKDEAKPASFFYTKDIKNKSDIYAVDLGLKITEWELLPNSPLTLTVAPTLEYHVNKTDTFTVNNAAAGVNIQSQLWRTSDGITPGGHSIAPWVLLSSNLQRDYVKKTNLLKVKGYLSIISAKGLRPSLGIQNNSRSVYFRFYPYVGYEYYRGLKTEITSSSSYLTERLFFEFWPGLTKNVEVTGGTAKKKILQITFDYSLRQKINDDYYKVNDTHFIDIGLNYYLLGNDKLGIGAEYSEGFDPGSNFQGVKKIALGVKLKL